MNSFGKPMRLAKITALLTLTILSSSACASAGPSCTGLSAAPQVVSSIESTKPFRRDWAEFRDDLEALEGAIELRDQEQWLKAAASSQSTMRAVAGHAPIRQGTSCNAIVAFAQDADVAGSNLSSQEKSFDWTRAAFVTAQMRESTDKLRDALPEWWFLSNHRHGRTVHRGK